jgi:thioredoxin 1
MLTPILSKAVADNQKTTLVKVDVDSATEIAAKYQIAAMPTVFAFHKGKVVDQFVGMRDKKFLSEFVKNHGDRQ